MGVRKIFGAAARRKAIRSDSPAGGLSASPSRGRSPPAGGPDACVSAEVAGYIAQMAAEMGQMAGAARLDILAYLLSMASQEAEMSARRMSSGGHDNN